MTELAPETGSTGGPLLPPLLPPMLTGQLRRPLARAAWKIAIGAATVLIVGLLVWQGVTAQGNPDPTTAGLSHWAAILQIGVLVFREGLEAILVLAALTASLVRAEEGHWKPVALGAGASVLATIITWFAVVALITTIDTPERALAIQAATGLLAVVVLLIVMNWFFHKIYWTGWITFQNRRKRALIDDPARNRKIVLRGLALIGFTSVYREGFEVVLFLQQYRLQVGAQAVYVGALIGLALTAIVAVLTFVAHYKLPYKRMLVFTGIMLGAVLLVMVGEEVFEMQQANWIPTHTINIAMPAWLNTWFSIYPSVESLAAQFAAGAFVIGSYFLARRVCVRGRGKSGAERVECIVGDCENCAIDPAGDAAPDTRVTPLQVSALRKD